VCRQVPRSSRIRWHTDKSLSFIGCPGAYDPDPIHHSTSSLLLGTVHNNNTWLFINVNCRPTNPTTMMTPVLLKWTLKDRAAPLKEEYLLFYWEVTQYHNQVEGTLYEFPTLASQLPDVLDTLNTFTDKVQIILAAFELSEYLVDVRGLFEKAECSHAEWTEHAQPLCTTPPRAWGISEGCTSHSIQWDLCQGLNIPCRVQQLHCAQPVTLHLW